MHMYTPREHTSAHLFLHDFIYIFVYKVEGERLLLVATHKRTAALNEISKLKTEGKTERHSAIAVF